MANKAISELPQAQNVNNQDLFVLEQSGIAKKLTAETFITEQGIIDALAEALDGHGGIQSVTLASVSGRIRTYRITFSDGSATTFQVYDGTSIERISRTSSSGLDDVYTVFLSDGTTTFFTVHNGADGNVSEAMLNDAVKDKAPAVTETTESSAIANFTDGADDMPIQSLVAEIEPIQDLTYGDPYPAGSGKNKFGFLQDIDTTVNGVRLTYSAESGAFNISGTNTNTTSHFLYRWYKSENKAQFPNFEAGKTFTLFCDNTAIQGMYMQFTYTNTSNTASPMGYMNANTGKTTFTVPDNFVALREFQLYVSGSATELNGTFHIWVEEGTVSSSSFTPYSNICPISGHTEVNVTRTGKNLFDQATVLSSLGFGLQSDGSWLYTRDSYWPVYQQKVWENATGYTGQIAVSLDVKYGTSGKIGLYFKFVYTDGTNESILGSATGDFVSTSAVSNASKTVDYIMTYFSYNVADTSTAFKNVQLELGSTATAYEPYQGNTVTVDWTTEAGTVYGGTIDVATGLLTVDRAIVTLDGGLQWQTWGVNNRTQGITGFYLYRRAVSSVDYSNYRLATLTNMFPINSLVWGGNAVGYYSNLQASVERDWYEMLGVPNDSVGIVDTDTNEQALSKFNAFLTATPLQVVHMLATPQAYQLTPQEVIKTLLGTNNVWADTGDTSVTYVADTKMFIEKLTMPTEDDLVANQAITSGKYFMIGNSLYLALANIASGAQITIGTNAQRVSLADALNTINS